MGKRRMRRNVKLDIITLDIIDSVETNAMCAMYIVQIGQLYNRSMENLANIRE